MENIRDLSEKLLQNSLENNLTLGRIILDSLLAVLPNESAEQCNVSNWLITGFCFKVIASDGKISDKEVEYFNKLMNVDYSKETITEKMNYFKNELDNLIQTVSEYKEEIKNNFLTLAILFAVADGEVANEELEILNKINQGLGEEDGI